MKLKTKEQDHPVFCTHIYKFLFPTLNAGETGLSLEAITRLDFKYKRYKYKIMSRGQGHGCQ